MVLLLAILLSDRTCNDHGLRFHVIVERFFAVFFAEATLFHTAEWELVEDNLWRIDPCIPGFKSLRGLSCFVEITSPDRRAKAVDRVVRFFDRLIQVADAHDGQSRTEYFFKNDSGVFVHIGEQCRQIEVSCCERLSRRTLAARQNASTAF